MSHPNEDCPLQSLFCGTLYYFYFYLFAAPHRRVSVRNRQTTVQVVVGTIRRATARPVRIRISISISIALLRRLRAQRLHALLGLRRLRAQRVGALLGLRRLRAQRLRALLVPRRLTAQRLLALLGLRCLKRIY